MSGKDAVNLLLEQIPHIYIMCIDQKRGYEPKFAYTTYIKILKLIYTFHCILYLNLGHGG